VSKPVSAISQGGAGPPGPSAGRRENLGKHIVPLVLIALTGFLGTCDAVGLSQRPQKDLLPRTASDLRVRFSPDGQYVLAQDDSWVIVLTRRPFHALFRIPADDAGPAEFTPDSRQILFVSSVASLQLASSSSPAHVERWSIAERARVGFAEIRLHGCDSKGLSPDGLVLACVDFGGTLRLLDVASGETIFEKERFGKPVVLWVEPQWRDPLDLFPRHELGDPGCARIDFSPDGRLFLALPHHAVGSAFAFDLAAHKPLALTRHVRGLIAWHDFAFLTPDRLIISEVRLQPSRVTARLIAFPSGKLLSRTKIPPGPVFRAADPRFVLVRPCGPFPRYDSDWERDKRTGACDLSTGQLTITRTPALDVFGDHYVAESAKGEIGLYERGKPAAVATVRLDAR